MSPYGNPGAVQGFGVPVVIQEDDNGVKHLVRQVLENATEFLGLRGSLRNHHFLSTCFTDVLPESHVGILWDIFGILQTQMNLQMKNFPSEDDSPHVFLLGSDAVMAGEARLFW
ncbi:hypothetical protein BC826DRAFT_38952 [Russula brevipes]|nr:hypothetical protein BC826DRAFT_38952 [Russula brevipes]